MIKFYFVTVNQGYLGNAYYAGERAKKSGEEILWKYQDLETAATVFKFAADHTTVEWKLDVYDDNGTRTAAVTTDGDPWGR